MSEKYGKYGVKYYAVAVVKKSNQGLNLNSLKGRKSCHTAARRTAGWRVPIGYMLRNGIMPAVACGNDKNDFLSVAEFFKESCVPGKEQNKLSLDCPTRQPRTQQNWDTRVSCVNGAQRKTREKVAWKRSCEAFFLMLYSNATTTFMVWFFAHIQDICLKKWTKTLSKNV